MPRPPPAAPLRNSPSSPPSPGPASAPSTRSAPPTPSPAPPSIKKGDATEGTVTPTPKARTRPGSSFLGKCKHADFLARLLPGLADLIDQADALRNDLAEVKGSLARALSALEERARVLQMGGRPRGVDVPTTADPDDIARGDHVAYNRRGPQPEECIVEENGKARIRRPSGRRLTVPPRRLSSLIPF